ncbi:RNA methyltransferase [Erysipelothrix larvae]|uniref:Putative tRNA (cytidine(34)-2'-O)-methyltransferase n=1 Tax=Erysipelothrix larvae TaxID=1514105 RepID=A0A120JTN9_9FIRM|nr:tRNA (cytidine(34)-2'-O)-methyltransferase [Erysipelothrix larvae]AMC93468.1 RNA methyltransferase [Erysipelothrix larvae]
MIHIVLYNPEIPQNTGNIMRTCVATEAHLHLIEPLGFKFDEKRVRRSVMDYFDYLHYTIHPSFEEFMTTVSGQVYFLTRYGHKPHSEFNFKDTDEDIYLVFGAESTGIPLNILKEHLDHCFRVPMAKEARSLNLSNTVAICVYEVLRQQGYPHLSVEEVQKGANFLDDSQ